MKINNTIRKFLLFIIAPLLTISLITACGDDDDGPVDPPPSSDLNLVELAQSDEDFSILVDVIVDLGLEETLAESDFTVFAPTNAAFNALPDGVLDNLTDDQLLDIIQFHVTEGSVPSSSLGAQQDVTMLNEERTLVQSSAAGVVVNGSSNVVEADLEATNGYIHAIDEVLLPRDVRVALEMPSLVEVAEEAGNFETLLTLVEDAGLTTTLQFLGPYTAFAPNDDAFANLGVDPGSLTTEQLQFILTYHVIAGAEIASGDLQAEQTVASAAEENLYITSDENGVFVNGSSEVIAPDIDDATNGIIHVVDSVLLPNAFLDITGIAQKNYDLSTLVGLLVDNNLVETLQGDGPFTVFAPTNAAFEAIEGVVAGLTSDEVVEVLTYHVLADNIESGDLDASQTVQMLNEQGVDITVDGDVVTIEDASGGTAQVTVADQIGTNGVVHIIDAVLIPNLDGGNGGGGDGELLTNGDFEAETRAPWTETAGEIREEGGNKYFFADIGTAGNPWDVNLSQVVEIVEGENYILEFDASTGTGNTRSMIAGIGQNGGDFVSVTETVNLTDQTQTFTLEFTANFSILDESRVLFDMGAEVGVVVIDNVSLTQGGSGGSGDDGSGGGDIAEPTSVAPTPPSRDAANVISLFSNAYSNVNVSEWTTSWSNSTTTEDIQVEGDDVKKITFEIFNGIELESSIDLSEFTHMHIDYWVADELSGGEVFNTKLSNHGGLPGTGGETGAVIYTNPATVSQEWVSLDVPLDDFTNAGSGNLDRDKIFELILDPSGTLDVVYIDNFYFYKE